MSRMIHYNIITYWEKEKSCFFYGAGSQQVRFYFFMAFAMDLLYNYYKGKYALYLKVYGGRTL
jgi:hypothetical protein